MLSTLIINTILQKPMILSGKIPDINTNMELDAMKIYDFYGKKNICGARVKEARKRMKLSQSELAARLQVAGVIIERDSLSRIEIGTRFVSDFELVVLADLLNVSVLWLLGIA